jgi:hypothetical protein
MQKAKILRAIDRSTTIQLLCTNGLELLSVYFESKLYTMFCRAIAKAGLKQEGLQILFDRQKVHVLALGKSRGFSHCLTRTNEFPLVN